MKEISSWLSLWNSCPVSYNALFLHMQICYLTTHRFTLKCPLEFCAMCLPQWHDNGHIVLGLSIAVSRSFWFMHNADFSCFSYPMSFRRFCNFFLILEMQVYMMLNLVWGHFSNRVWVGKKNLLLFVVYKVQKELRYHVICHLLNGYPVWNKNWASTCKYELVDFLFFVHSVLAGAVGCS